MSFSCCDENLIAHTALQIETGARTAVDVVNKLETVQFIYNTYHCERLITEPTKILTRQGRSHTCMGVLSTSWKVCQYQY